MTDRLNALIVILEHDIREDDAEPIINAIQQLRGVLQVEPHVADSIGDAAAEARVRSELTKKLFAVLYKEDKV